MKKDPSYHGVLDLSPLSDKGINELLATVEVADVWGIGSKYARFLTNYGITTAKDLKYADEKWIRKYVTVTGARIVLELRGISCIPLESERPPKQAMMCAKTFGREVTTLEDMQEAITTYAARVAEKLREQDSLTSRITVFVRTNALKQTIDQYSNSFTIELAYPTAFTPEILSHALTGLNAIYRPGYQYSKAGVFLSHITPQSALQPDLFGDFSLTTHLRQARLMMIVDAITACMAEIP